MVSNESGRGSSVWDGQCGPVSSPAGRLKCGTAIQGAEELNGAGWLLLSLEEREMLRRPMLQTNFIDIEARMVAWMLGLSGDLVVDFETATGQGLAELMRQATARGPITKQELLEVLYATG